MEPKGPAAFKYTSDGSSNAGLVALLITSLIVSIIGALNISGWFAWGLLLPVGLAIYLTRFAASKNMIVAPRYLIVGEQIIYYTAVAKAQLNRRSQTLTLISDKGKRLVIEAEKFPTNARKAEKIKHNKTAKFDKAVEKILSRLPEVTPEIIG